ncbi:hypothetical protein [Kribbella sp. NPDC048928]|uniref:hypothetical protein n=1 Tax=Kribbella sp. NPDC048928 TaxID=3364111 RepID=UPI0037123929
MLAELARWLRLWCSPTCGIYRPAAGIDVGVSRRLLIWYPLTWRACWRAGASADLAR